MNARLPNKLAVDERALTAADIDSLTDAGIAKAARYALRAPFYRNMFAEHGLSAADIRTRKDLARIPFTTKTDLGTHGDAFWAVPPEKVTDIATTSGTTGLPTLYPQTVEDIDRLGWNEYLSFRCAGLTASDTVLLAVTMDRCFIAGLAYFEGLCRIGATVVRIGSGPPGMLLSFMERLQPTAVVSVPSFLKKVAHYAGDNGIDLRQSPVKKLICIGEPVRETDFTLNPLGAQLASSWNAAVYSTYGLTELAVSFCECDSGCGGHVHPSLVHVEVVDDAGAPVADGQVGEIVATAFGVRAMPLLRFRTGDCSFITRRRCSCGLWTPRIGPIVGRKNQLMKIKGTSVYPAAVQRIMNSLDEVRDYVMICQSQTALSDELTLLIAANGDAGAAKARIEQRLQGELKVKPIVRIADLAEIEELQGASSLRKKRQFIDRRDENRHA